MSDYLNIAALCPSTIVLGPGKRFVIWVQGCCFDCPDCGSPEWREIKDEMLIPPDNLAEKILSIPELNGITISGGEPMLQAKNLHKLVRLLRPQKSLSVICYTGFTLEQLQKKEDTDINNLLSETDVLIDGPYIDSLNDNKGWRGSCNQRIHFLSGLYKEREQEFLNRKRDIEIHLLKDHYLLVGIHPENFDFRRLTAKAG